MFRLLPWEYGIRNLFRRPGRSLLTGLALTLVVGLVLIVAGFLRGLEHGLAVSGDPRVILLHAPGGTENLEASAIAGRAGPVVAIDVRAVQRRFGVPYVSPEIYLGTRVSTADNDTPTLGLVRGVTSEARLVRRQVQLIEGAWPERGEVMVGRLAPAKLGRPEKSLRPGETLNFEGRTWIISGRFAAGGSVLESELWCRLDDLQQATNRQQDCSLVALTLAPGREYADVDEFCKQRLDLELQATPEVEYYAALQKHYRPVRALAWAGAILILAAGGFAGMNAMYGSVLGRARELATLQAIGFRRRALVISLIQESLVLASAACLLASTFALLVLDGLAVRFTMGAFALRIDGPALLAGCAATLILGLLGALPPAVHVLRPPIAEGLKAF